MRRFGGTLAGLVVIVAALVSGTGCDLDDTRSPAEPPSAPTPPPPAPQTPPKAAAAAPGQLPG
jgi:hypothetical protein